MISSNTKPSFSSSSCSAVFSHALCHRWTSMSLSPLFSEIRKAPSLCSSFGRDPVRPGGPRQLEAPIVSPYLRPRSWKGGKVCELVSRWTSDTRQTDGVYRYWGRQGCNTQIRCLGFVILDSAVHGEKLKFEIGDAEMSGNPYQFRSFHAVPGKTVTEFWPKKKDIKNIIY